MKRFPLLSLFLLLSTVGFCQTPAPVACYNFSGNLNESNGGTPLTTITGLGTYTKGLSQCTYHDPIATDSLYNWIVDQGLDLVIGNTFSKYNYTIELLFKFTSVPYQRSWQRIMDFKSNASDLGLYTFQSGTNYNLQMYTQNTATTNTMASPNMWIHLFVTRDSLTGTMNGYINDSLQISFNDAAGAGVFTSDLILFKDDIVVTNEESAGTIDFLRIFNQPLTKSQISYIVTTTQPSISVSGNRNICLGDSTTLAASGASYYLWSTGESTSSITINPSVSTFYTVTAWNYVFCTKSCKTLDTLSVNVTPCGGTPPVCNFTASDSVFCDEGGRCVSFFDQSSGSPTSWQWSFPGAVPDTSTLQNPTGICYYTPGTYAVSLITSNASGSDTLQISSKIIFRSGAALPILKVSNDTIFCSHEFSYQWYYNGNPVTGAVDSFFVAIGDGSYSVLISDNFGCIRLSQVVLFTGMQAAVPAVEGIEVYPNPAGNWFTVYGLRFTVSSTLELFNALGEKIYSAPFSGTQTIDLDLKAGFYYVQLTNGVDQVRKKIIRQ